MRKSLLASVSMAAFVLGASAARSADFSPPEEPTRPGAYLSLFGGFTIAEDLGIYYDAELFDTSFKNGFAVGGAYGEYIAPQLRGEIEVSYQDYSSDTYNSESGAGQERAGGYVSQLNLLFNIWKDFDVGGSMVPYIGAGLGAGIGKINIQWDGDGSDPDSRGSNAGIAGQLGAGLRMPVSDQAMVDIGYRFRSLVGIIDIDGRMRDAGVAHYYNHTFQAGVSYALGPGFVQPVADFEPDTGSDSYFTVFGGAAVPEASAIAQDGGYGYELKNKTGFTVGVAVGSVVAPGVRTEIEASYTHYTHDTFTVEIGQEPEEADGETSLVTILGNVWKDVPLGMATPYLGGGVGVGIADSHGEMGTQWDDTRVGLALQLGAGVRVAATDTLSVDLGYRAKGVVGVTLKGSDGDEHSMANFMTHTAQVGITYGGGAYVEPAAFTGSGHYISLFGGAAEATDTLVLYDDASYGLKFKTGFTVGAALGTQLLDSVRGELEVAYSELDLTCARTGSARGDVCTESYQGDVNTVTIMTNIWKDFGLGVFAPYVGGGVGVALFTSNVEERGWEDTNPAMTAQAGTGVRMAVSDDLTLDVGYRFRAVFDPLWTGSTDGTDYYGIGTLQTHNVQGGVSWGF